MDNASKALIFAGGILIAVLVISVSIYLLTMARGVAKTSNEKVEANAVQSFNRFYTAYGDGTGNTVTGIDALNIYRKATDDINREAAFRPMEIKSVPTEIESISELIDNGTGDPNWADDLDATYEFSYVKDVDGYIYEISID